MVCRTSHEVRGLKYYVDRREVMTCGVSPHTRCVDWNRNSMINTIEKNWSHLTRGAWIEIWESRWYCFISEVAPHTRCVDWNCFRNTPVLLPEVAPHTRCVDWNWLNSKPTLHLVSRTSHEVRGLKWINVYNYGNWTGVAPHTRCVDWNILIPRVITYFREVAPHTRCVDWNMGYPLTCDPSRLSHLTRGAWIEM